jgi:hypothetical protein
MLVEMPYVVVWTNYVAMEILYVVVERFSELLDRMSATV